ncbi:MAG: Fur family transcriptional regulator [Actinomycetota bacterium]
MTKSQPTPSSRATRQRTAILEVLGAQRSFLSARQIHARLERRHRDVALATVYRTLKSLSRQGTLDVIPGNSEALYCLCRSSGHHHHLVCRSCGASVELENPQLESWADEVAGEHGFEAVDHTLELYGTCRTCAAG